jgi:5'-nucleotidase
MHILLTNDDGISAPGLVALYHELCELGDVEVVAPATVQSAAGHGVTLSTPLLTTRMKIEGAFTGIAVEGRPADCVKLAIAQLLSKPPDLVVSGMNSGANVGINVIYSGTVAAAIEGAFLGVPSVAVSLHLHGRGAPDYARGAKFAREAIEKVLEAGLRPGQVASINVPALESGEMPRGIRLARQCTRPWTDAYERRQDPRGRDYFWYSSAFKLNPGDDETDVAALQDKFITITPLQFDLTDPSLMKSWPKDFSSGRG